MRYIHNFQLQSYVLLEIIIVSPTWESVINTKKSIETLLSKGIMKWKN